MNEKLFYDAIEPYIIGKTNLCSYCEKIKPLIIYYGEHFYITAAIGAFMPGYIQLCSYMHRTSATGILPQECEELEILTNAIRQSFFKVYGNYGISFEHGQAGSCLWKDNFINDLCHHMHIHYMPHEINIHDDIIANFSDYFEVKDIYDMRKIRQDVLCADQYLYFSPQPKIGYMYKIAGLDVPRQFLRRCVAKKLGMVERADWQEYPGVEFFNKTINDLKDVIVSEVKN
jgi:hypothetical protein